MSLYEGAVKKPIMTSLCFLAVAIFGLFSLSKLPVDLYPDIDTNTIMVMTSYQGASASDIENNVTRPLENTLNSVSNLKHITSKSSENISVITLEFEYGYDIDVLTNDVRDKLDMVSSELPDEVNTPIIFKFSTDMIPILLLSVQAEESQPALYKILDDNVVNPLARVPGVGTVSIAGAPKREVNIYCDPNKLEAYDLTIETISSIVRAENKNTPGGTFDVGSNTYSLRVEGEFKDPKEMENIVVGIRNGASVYLRDVATVVDSVEERAQETYNNGVQGAMIVVQKQSGTVQNLTKYYGDRLILKDISFDIQPGEKVAILGANGAGKTTMLKILRGEEVPDGGVIRKGVGLKPAYLPQQVYFANPHRNLIDTLIYDKNVSMQVARNRLGSFQFIGETQLKTVDMLSGGEKSRLRLCELMYDPLNLLILDEPTNHLDLASREWIEEAVEAFDGTLLFVSHDRYFVERFATRVLYLENGHLTDFIGSYSAFLDWRAKGGGALPEAAPAPAPKKKKAAVPTLDDVPKPPEKPKRTGGTKNLQKLLNTLEREISQLETQSSDLEQQMVDAASDSGRLLELMTEKEACDEKLAAKMDEWEAVAAELEELQ